MNELKELAPIALFVYNRQDHAHRTIEALKMNTLAKESELYIFSDAPKDQEAIESVAKVREYLKSVSGFKSVTINERKENFGIEKSIITGVTELINKYGKIIVLEDDLVSSPDFLSYMNEALELYKDEEKVYSITGYSFTTNSLGVRANNTYFLNLSSAWSWATWKNRWSIFENTSSEDANILKINKDVRSKFNIDDSYNYAGMLEEQLSKGATTWDIDWYWSTFKKGGLTLYPQKALVNNIGFDGSGVHCGNNQEFDITLDTTYKYKLTDKVEEDLFWRAEVAKELNNRRPTFTKRIVQLLKSIRGPK